MTPSTLSAPSWSALRAIFDLPSHLSPLRWTVHEADLSIELFFPPGLDAAWVPSEGQLRAVADLGFLAVYAVFPDETEVVGCWRITTRDGVRVAGGEVFRASSRREPVGTPRYVPGHALAGVTLSGPDLPLFEAFLRWRAAHGDVDWS